MNKSLLIQNGIAGGIAGTVADGLFKDEDNHSYAKSAFMGTLAGVGATALHQKWPVTKSGAQAPADHVPPTAPTQPTAAPTAPVQQPTAATVQTEPVAKPAPVVAQAQPAAPQPVQRPSAQAAETPEPVAPIKPEEPAKPIQTPVAPAESAKQPTAASEPVQQPAAAPSVEKQTERERIIEREPEARAQVEPKPAEQPKAVQPVQTEPVKPIQITPEKQPEPATQPVQQRRQKPVRPTPKVVRNEPKPEEFVGPHDQSKLTKTINSVKQSASNVGNGILEGAKNIVATASKLKIPPIELNISGAGKQIAQAGRSIASGLARSAQALSIAAIASMDMGGSHAVVQHAYETATHAVQVQASMATSTMTRAVKDAGEAVSNYHPMQGVENAVRDIAAVPEAAQSTQAIPEAIKDSGIYQYADETAKRMAANKTNKGNPFIVADPRTGSVNTYDATGSLTGRHTALFGANTKNTEKGLTSMIGTEKEKEFAKRQKQSLAEGYKWIDENNMQTSEPGIFDLKKVQSSYPSEHGSLMLAQTKIFGKTDGAPGVTNAFHNIYTGAPEQRRMERLLSSSTEDNFVSAGCVNLNPLDLQKNIIPKMKNDVVAAVLPYNRNKTSPYLGLSADPMADKMRVAKK